MRYLLIVLLAAGCVAPEGKKNENNDNGGTNATPNFAPNNVNASNVNPNGDPNVDPNVEPNGDPNADPNVDPNVEPNIDPNVDPNVDPNIDPNVEPNVEPGLCESRAMCFDDEECVDGECMQHQVCGTAETGNEGDLYCFAQWYECDTGDYYFECYNEGTWFCTCYEGDISTQVEFADDPCAPAGIHIAANAGCGWLMPEVPQ